MFCFVLYFKHIQHANNVADVLLRRSSHFFSLGLDPSMIMIEELSKNDLRGGWSVPGTYMTIAAKAKEPGPDGIPRVHISDYSMVMDVTDSFWGTLLSFQAVPA